MASGGDRIYLSMQDTDTGEYLTANVYTVEGVTNVDGSPRRLSIGQLVMALCLQRAAALEADIVDKMNHLEDITEKLELMTQIETSVLEDEVNMKTKTLTYKGESMTYYEFLRRETGVQTIPETANADSTDFLTELESEMDSNNSFSQQTMIELQSQTTKRDQCYDMISNVLKSVNTVLVGNANNL